MTTQVDFIVVSEFIRPLRVLFGEIGEQQEAVYCKHLRRFSQAQLNAGVEFLETHHRYKRFPQLAECIEACERKDEGFTGGVVDHQAAYPWVVRGQEAQKLLDEHLQFFQANSQLLAEAKRDDWDIELMRYVRKCAWFQAQTIAGVTNKGFNNSDGLCENVEQRDAFVKELAAMCKDGNIALPLPDTTIDKLKWLAKIRRESKHSGNLSGSFAA